MRGASRVRILAGDERHATIDRSLRLLGFGSSSQNINAGEITKHGIELGLRSHLVDMKRYGWDMNFNIATQDGQVKRLSGAPGDTNVDPDELDYIIPANDDAIRSIRLLCALVADAAIEGAGERAVRAVEPEPSVVPICPEEPASTLTAPSRCTLLSTGP